MKFSVTIAVTFQEILGNARESASSLDEQLEPGPDNADLFHERSVTQSRLSVLGVADLP